MENNEKRPDNVPSSKNKIPIPAKIGKYEIVRVIGQGGMGIVYEARDPHSLRRLALKIMYQHFVEGELLEERFRREIQAQANLLDDHIVPIYDVDQDENRLFFTMPFLSGEDLGSYLRRQNNTPLKVNEVLRISREIAVGLQKAHQRGLVHRDIKPGNLWIDFDNDQRIKILDFGLVNQFQLVNENQIAEPNRSPIPTEKLTRTGIPLGTPWYMSPEQSNGASADSRSDLYSLGVVMYEMATGKLPFQSDHLYNLLKAIWNDAPVPPSQINSQIPAELNTFLLKLLAKKPEDRPQSAKQVLAEIQRIENLVLGIDPPVPPKKSGKSRMLAAFSLLFSGVVLTALIWVLSVKLSHSLRELKFSKSPHYQLPYVLDHDHLYDSLIDLGFETKKLNEDWLQILKESSSITRKILIGLGPDKSEVWIKCNLTRLENPNSISAPVWQKLLSKNNGIGRAVFKYSEKDQMIVLCVPLINEGITIDQLREEINHFDRAMQKSYLICYENELLGKNDSKIETSSSTQNDPNSAFMEATGKNQIDPRISGRWKVTDYQDQGSNFEVDANKLFIMEFSDNKMTTLFNGQVQNESAYTVRKAGEYHQLDTTAKTGLASLGIYKIAEKKLSICVSPAGSQARPTEFKSTPENKAMLLTLEKIN